MLHTEGGSNKLLLKCSSGINVYHACTLSERFDDIKPQRLKPVRCRMTHSHSYNCLTWNFYLETDKCVYKKHIIL